MKELEAMLEKAKENTNAVIDLAEYLLEIITKSSIPNSIALFICKIKDSLLNNGFTREETINIINNLDITSILKQERNS